MSKSDWGPGQWQTEPDYDKWLDPFTGWQCHLWRHPGLGHWCGYVDVPNDAIQNGRSIHQLQSLFEDSIRVHGGVTYYGHQADTNTLRIGFDTAHHDDYAPGVHKAALRLECLTYRNHAYCWLETFQMCQQIAELLDV